MRLQLSLLGWFVVLAAIVPVTVSIFLLHGMTQGHFASPKREPLIYIADELRPPWVPKAAIDPKGMQVRGKGGDFRTGDDLARHHPSRLLVQMAKVRAVHKCAQQHCADRVQDCQESSQCNIRWASCVQDSCSVTNASIANPVECVAACMRGEERFVPVQGCLERHCEVSMIMRDRGRISDLVFS